SLVSRLSSFQRPKTKDQRPKTKNSAPTKSVIDPPLDLVPHIAAERRVVRGVWHNDELLRTLKCREHASRMIGPRISILRAVNQQNRNGDARGGRQRAHRIRVAPFIT